MQTVVGDGVSVGVRDTGDEAADAQSSHIHRPWFVAGPRLPKAQVCSRDGDRRCVQLLRDDAENRDHGGLEHGDGQGYQAEGSDEQTGPLGARTPASGEGVYLNCTATRAGFHAEVMNPIETLSLSNGRQTAPRVIAVVNRGGRDQQV